MWILVAAVAVGAVTIAAGVFAVHDRPVRYSASASVLIAPPVGDAGLAVTGSDTLSRGTIVATYAEAYAGGRNVTNAYAKAGLPTGTAASVDLETRVLAGTSIIEITTTSESAIASERAANALASYAPELFGYSVAFKPSIIENADGSAEVAGPSGALLLAMIVALGLAAAGLVFGGLGRLLGGSAGRAAARTDAPPNPAH
jgi:capsular polysaccharide biosynthesis protein